MNNKKILILAYTNLNFGDDMFIYTLCKKFPNNKFVLYANKEYRKKFADIVNLEIKKKSFFNKKFNSLLNHFPTLYKYNINTMPYSAVVYVIGGLFDEDDLWKRQVANNGLLKMKNLIWQNCFDSKTPFYLLGCNLTRVLTQKYIDELAYLFKDLRDICFRDLYSYNKMSFLDNVRHAPDIVFNYDCKVTSKLDMVVISVWGPLTRTNLFPQWKWAEKLWGYYKKFIIDITNEFGKLGKRVVFLALCENEGDLDACNIIKKEGNLNVDIITYQGNLDEIIKIFEDAYFVVGTRFHSIVMAINSNCAFYPIVYENKTLQLLNDIEYDSNFSHIEQPDTYDVTNVIHNYKVGNIISSESIKREALKQFQVLKEDISK